MSVRAQAMHVADRQTLDSSHGRNENKDRAGGAEVDVGVGAVAEATRQELKHEHSCDVDEG